jgi:hypothetical protein
MATAPWSVRVELAAPCAVSDDVTDELTDRLRDLAAAVAVEDDDRIAVQLTIEAGTLRAAFTRGEKAVTDAIAGLLRAEIVEVQVLTEAEFERRLERPRVPELWGVSEAAEFLGVTPPRIDQLEKENPEKLPRVTKLKGRQGPRIWLKSTWVRFEAGWERKRGRPSVKEAPAPASRAG